MCWNRIMFQGGSVTNVMQLSWPDGCRGTPPANQTICTQMTVPLTASEVYAYQQWINAGRPYLPGCELYNPTPSPQPTCVPTGQLCGGIRGTSCPTGTSCVYSNGTNRAIYPDESGTCQIQLVKSGTLCGGISGQSCPIGTRCVYESGLDRAPFPDASGTCQPTSVPVACPTGGVYPTPTPTNCQGPNGSYCTISSCPVCTSRICPMYACQERAGTCQNNTCVPNPTPTPPPPGWCPGPNGTTCQTTINIPVKCVPQPGYVCPSGVRFVTGICQNNVCIAPTPTPTPPAGCYYTTACTNSIPPTCTTTLYCPPTPACIRNAPKVSISPVSQSGNPGTPLLYIANITNTDTNCSPTAFTLTTQVPSGFTGYLASNTVTLSSGASTGISFMVTSPSTNPNASSQTVPISFTAKNSASGLSATANASYTFVQPNPVTVKFRFKFAGVTGNNAGAIKEAVKVTFAPRYGAAYNLKPDLVLSFAGDGVYEASYNITNPLPPDTEFTMLVKGPKHGAIRFCQQTGQTAPCTYGQFMRLTGLTFDFTGRPLPPGDLNQDGTIDTKDIKLVTDLLNKPSSQYTDADIKLADVNYDTYVDNTDLGLIVRSLSSRQDE